MNPNASLTDPNYSEGGAQLSLTPTGKLRITESFANANAITKSDATIYTPPLQGLWVGGSGNVNVTMLATGEQVVFTGVPSGTFLPVVVTQVYSTSTTATNIVGVW